tara:strand:- start:774 stop:1376 length:603 start_codon:yes stop_codon:yes gene_type:complete
MNDLSVALQSLFSQPVKQAITMVEINWPSGTVYAHDGVGPIVWNGHTWYGVGQHADLGDIEDSSLDQSFTLTLRTASLNDVAEAVRDDAGGREVIIYLGGLDDDMRLVDVHPMASGFINTTPVGYELPPTISVECVGLDYRWNFAKRHTSYNSAIHRELYPTDSYCDDVESVASSPLTSYSSENAVSAGARRRTTRGQQP